VLADGMAERAGVRAGDRLLSLAGAPLGSLIELGRALRVAGGARDAELRFRRGALEHTARVEVQHFPDEEGVCYGVLEVEGARLRTLATHPAGRARATVLVLPGIACEPVDFAPLVHGWTDAGLATLRVDKRGVGDSEGGRPDELDFVTELADLRAALASLPAGPVVLFGHSVGGTMAALLAAERPLAGVMVYGSSPVKWLECLAATTLRQLRLRGASADTIAASVAELQANARRTGLNGRSAAYHRQLDAIDLEAAWAQVSAPTLVLRGELDWVVGVDEQARIAALVPGARLVDLPGLDHMLSWHADLAASLRDYGAGRWDPAPLAATLEWMADAGVGSPP
jgi:pimeloyl-ACP methyl ester carboxylesterase